MKRHLVLTCEHGGNQIPPEFRTYFRKETALLKSHRGWDPGALDLAKRLNKKLKAPLFYSETSRLLIDLNRSPSHPNLFSPHTKALPRHVKDEIFAGYYSQYRKQVFRHIHTKASKKVPVLHLSIHSFTPILNGIERNCETAFLYDPSRRSELDFAKASQAMMRFLMPEVRVRLNYPYKGISDGLTSALRKSFSVPQYSGLEIELNQEFLSKLARHKKLDDFSTQMAWIITQIL